MITSISHFNGLIHIPNSNNSAPNSSLIGNQTKLNYFIQKYENELLIDCLGYSLATEFSNEFDTNTTNGLKATSNQKWDDLLNGKEYLLNDVLVKWRGFKFYEGQFEQSITSYYIFCEFIKNDAISYRGTGTKVEKSKNAKDVSVDRTFINAYREFHKLTEFSDCKSSYRSLYDFISDMNAINSDHYKSWNPKRFENQNILGI